MTFFRQRETIRFQCQGEVLLFAYAGAHALGAAINLGRSPREVDCQAFLSELEKEAPKGVWLLKAVGSDQGLSSLERSLHALGWQISGQAKVTTSIHGFFYVETGRLRIEETASPAAQASSANETRKVRVLIVDDSKTMRQLLRRIVSSAADLEVVGEAELPSQVEKLIADTRPDVMTLDINMPEMSGVELLQKLLVKKFVPTVMISSVGINEGYEVLRAFELGAVDYIQKPSANEMASVTAAIQDKLRSAAKAVMANVRQPAKTAPRLLGGNMDMSKIIAIGASTGGTEAIKNVFLQLPKEIPPIVVVQHIPAHFSTAFANRLNELCPFEVREAQEGDEIRPGRALIAPGGFHMEVRRQGKQLFAKITDSPPVNRFKPSVDVLFKSVAEVMGKKAVGIILTGMGSDGAAGLLKMREAGAHTIGQDRDSCVVYGMPRAAFELGAVEDVCSLADIPAQTLKRVA